MLSLFKIFSSSLSNPVFITKIHYWNCVPIKIGRSKTQLQQYSPQSLLAYQKIILEVSERMDLLHEEKGRHVR